MRASTLLVALLLLSPVSAAAQATTTATTPPPARQTTPAPSTKRGIDVVERTRNVRLDLTITDTYGESPSRKTVSLLILDGNNGMIRTSNRLPTGVDVQLNVDATAHIIANGPAVRVEVTFEYTPAQSDDDPAAAKGMAPARSRPGRLHESITVRLTNGKPLMVSQSADPASDRKVTVELTATILDAAPDGRH
jgi:hypothetical protein